MHRVKRVHQSDELVRRQVFKSLRVVAKLVEIVQVAGALALGRKVSQNSHQGLGLENMLFLYNALLEVYPKLRVDYAVPVQKAGSP
jgi:H2-forming N5,N10-methylenetetrahydromethanopterin dehydrogenase-like enzyme